MKKENEKNGKKKIKRNENEIKELKQKLLNMTNHTGKIVLAQKIFEQGGNQDDIIEVEVKRYEKVIKKDINEIKWLFPKILDEMPDDVKKDVTKEVFEKDCMKALTNNKRLYTLYKAPSDICRLYYVLSIIWDSSPALGIGFYSLEVILSDKKIQRHVNYCKIRDYVQKLLSWQDTEFIMNMVDYLKS